MAKRRKVQRKLVRTINGGKPNHLDRTWDPYPITVYVEVDE